MRCNYEQVYPNQFGGRSTGEWGAICNEASILFSLFIVGFHSLDLGRSSVFCR